LSGDEDAACKYDAGTGPTVWGLDEDGDRNNGDSWGWGKFLSPCSSIVCSLQPVAKTAYILLT